MSPYSPSQATLRLLHLEDNSADAEMIQRELTAEWPDLRILRVETSEDFAAALRDEEFDLILSDFSLPRFDGLAALRLAGASAPTIPFVFLSGTIGEDHAVEALKQGATDYVIKDRMARLVPAIRRALDSTNERRRREEAEQLLRESQERFQQLADQSSEVFWFVSLNPETVLYVGPAIEQIWGRPAAEFYRDPRARLKAIHPADLPRVHRAYEDCIAGRTARFEEEYRVTTSHGGTRWVLDSATVIHDRSGQPVRLSGITKDITKRKADEDRLREQAELLDKAHDAIVVTDLDRRVVFWNRGAELVFGWRVHETRGLRGEDFFSTEAAQQFNLLHDTKEADESHGEIKLHNRAGEPRILNYSVTVIRDIEGRPKSRLIISTDITEQKELETQFLRAQRLESLGMLAAGIAHDLNNVLSPVLMGAPLLRPNASPADILVLQSIEKSAERGAALVRQILSFAHGTAGGKTLIQIKHLLADIGDLIKQTFPKSIQLEQNVPLDLWPIEGNPTQIHQIILNLCVNARDAMPQGGTLRLRAENRLFDEKTAAAYPDALPGPYLLLEVSDTGTGISPEILGQIWDPFFTTKGDEKGTGLGLATVRGIAANHDGFATVSSVVGRGTTFQVFIPAGEESSTPRESGISNHPFQTRGAGELVLVVDDEKDVGELIKLLLTRHGYRALVAADGAAAINLFTSRAAEFALVLTDVNMPGINGVELARALLRFNPAIRIVFMSGAGSGAVPTDMFAVTGPTLRKPFSNDELLSHVRRVLRKTDR